MWFLLVACHLPILQTEPSTVAGPKEWEQFVSDPKVAASYERFKTKLQDEGVADVVPAWHLWRQGTDWQKLSEPGFAVPPEDSWGAIVPTLQLIREEVVPVVGPVFVVSSFRTERFNRRAGGAAGSRHKWFEAVDVVPQEFWLRESLHGELMALWNVDGPRWNMGLGLYGGTRFHVDTHRHRKW